MGCEKSDLTSVKAVKVGVDHEEEARNKYTAGMEMTPQRLQVQTCRL